MRNGINTQLIITNFILNNIDISTIFIQGSTIMLKNNEKNDKFYRKVASLMYTEIVNFMPQSWKAASKLELH